MRKAVELVARSERILLDPVYSGMGMAGLIGLIRDNSFGPEATIRFLHTGGAAALGGYPDLF